MKILDKIALAIFSIIIFVLSVIACLVVFGWLDIEIIYDAIYSMKNEDIIGNITLGVSVVLILLSIKCIFFDSFSREERKSKDGILLENENGKLLVSKETIENLTNSVIKSFQSAESVMTKVEFDEANNVSIFVTLFVTPDTVIKDLSLKLQNNIKETIKNSIDLEVKAVNIQIKNINTKREQIVKE